MPGKSSEAQKEARANLQKKITALIGTYELPLPGQYINVDEGHNITTTNKISRELIGDSWMLWFITSELVKLYPNESSELYACIRGVLVSNVTFTALMRVYGVQESKGKTSADAFEMFVSLLVEKSGESGLRAWAEPTFLPLMRAAYAECGTLRQKQEDIRRRLSQGSTTSAAIEKLEIMLGCSTCSMTGLNTIDGTKGKNDTNAKTGTKVKKGTRKKTPRESRSRPKAKQNEEKVAKAAKAARKASKVTKNQEKAAKATKRASTTKKNQEKAAKAVKATKRASKTKKKAKKAKKAKQKSTQRTK